MTTLLDGSWFYWAIGVAIGLPVLVVVLTELEHALTRRGSGLARPVALIRTYILPLGALLVLMVNASQISTQATSVRIVSTVLGFVVLILLLSGLNATLFHSAPEGSWRQRIPTIFLDVARVTIIAIGLAMILSYIWGANVGGLFTALGVTSIVLGLALQNSVGQVISGLLLLFEQPFQIGDWLDTPSAKGRVVEVNWRATHIDTGSALQIIPNSVLAGASFANLSRPAGSHSITVPTVFAAGDPPDDVCAVLLRAASNLPQLRRDTKPAAVAVGAGEYRTSIPLHSPADAGAAKATFLRWVWYAARRADLHLDDADDEFATTERVADALRVIAPTLRLSPGDQQDLAPHVRLTRYGADEPVLFQGQVPDRMTFVVRGLIRLEVMGDGGAVAPVRVLETGDFLGQTALTREPVSASGRALTEVTVVQIERAQIEDLVLHNPILLQEIGRAIEDRRQQVRQVLAAIEG